MRPHGRRERARDPERRDDPIRVTIPEKLFFDMVDLLREPKLLTPRTRECVIGLERRNDVLNRLLTERRKLVEAISPTAPPAP